MKEKADEVEIILKRIDDMEELKDSVQMILIDINETIEQLRETLLES